MSSKGHSPQTTVQRRRWRVESKRLMKLIERLIAYRQPLIFNPQPFTVYHFLWTIDRRLWTNIVTLVIFVGFSGCGVYTFTGASLGPEVKTISIDNFYNDAGNGPPNMSQVFTEEIRDYYQANTNLALVQENGDLLLEGAITRYEFVPVAPRASGSNEVADVAGLVRLNITVTASYVNTYDDEFNFENKSFTFFADFSSDRDPSSVEDDLITEITDQIIFDIFAATVANW